MFIPWIVKQKMDAGPNSFPKFWKLDLHANRVKKEKHLKLTSIIFCNWKLGNKLSFWRKHEAFLYDKVPDSNIIIIIKLDHDPLRKFKKREYHDRMCVSFWNAGGLKIVLKSLVPLASFYKVHVERAGYAVVPYERFFHFQRPDLMCAYMLSKWISKGICG